MTYYDLLGRFKMLYPNLNVMDYRPGGGPNEIIVWIFPRSVDPIDPDLFLELAVHYYDEYDTFGLVPNAKTFKELMEGANII